MPLFDSTASSASKVLSNCPVCGHKPRVFVTKEGNTGYTCEIKCKPFLRKQHMSVSVYRNRESRAVSQAIEEWDYACIRYHPEKEK